MQTLAHVTNGVVDAVEHIPDGLVPGRDIFIAAYAEGLVAVPSGQAGQVKIGWTYSGGAFAALVESLTAAQLRAYASAKASAMLSVERVYDLGGGVSVKCDGSPKTVAALAGLKDWASGHPDATTQWTDNDLAATAITADHARSLALAASTYAQSVYNELGTVAVEITAGVITTLSQIDAAPWPV